MEGCVCCEQEETAPIPYGELTVLGCHCEPLCIFEEIRALWSVVYTYPHIPFHLYCGYREVEADLPYSFIYCDLKDHSSTQVSLD